jgi:hypothetical protein
MMIAARWSILMDMSTYSIHITDLMTRAHTVTRSDERVESLDELKAICRSIRGQAGEAIYVEARRHRRAGPTQRLSWAVA